MFPLLGLVLVNLVIVRNDPELVYKRHNKLNLWLNPVRYCRRSPLWIPKGFCGCFCRRMQFVLGLWLDMARFDQSGNRTGVVNQ